MSDLDPLIRSALRESTKSYGPPPRAEGRMLSEFHARLSPPPPPPDGAPGPELPGRALHLLRVVAATGALTAAGLGGLWLAGSLARSGGDSADIPARSAKSTPIQAAASPPARNPPQTQTSNPAAQTSFLVARDGAAPLRPAPSPQPASLRAGRGPEQRPAEDRIPDVESTLLAELELIDAARKAAPTEALILLDRHVREFGDGALRHERASLRVIALCDLGRWSLAQHAADRFAAAGPGPLLRRRVLNHCEERVSLAPETTSTPAGNGSN